MFLVRHTEFSFLRPSFFNPLSAGVTDRQTHTHIHTHTHTRTPTDRQKHKHKHKHTNTQPDTQIHRQTDR